MNNLLAQTVTLPGNDGSPTLVHGPLDWATDVGAIISRAIPFVFGFAGLGLLLMILSAGFTLLTSAGDAKKLESGKSRLVNAILGFLIIFTAFWIVQIVGRILGLSDITNSFQ
jgi:hypothetical protein